MAIYMKFGGFNGDATHSSHKQWTVIDALHWGVTQPRNTGAAGRMSSSTTYAPTFSDVTIVKQFDSTSSQLFKQALGSSATPSVKIDFVGASDSTFAKYELTNAMITGYQTASSSDGMPTETVTITFSQLQATFTPTGPDGKPSSPVVVGYDVAQAKTL